VHPTNVKNLSQITIRIVVRYVDGTLTGHHLEVDNSRDRTKMLQNSRISTSCTRQFFFLFNKDSERFK